MSYYGHLIYIIYKGRFRGFRSNLHDETIATSGIVNQFFVLSRYARFLRVLTL